MLTTSRVAPLAKREATKEALIGSPQIGNVPPQVLRVYIQGGTCMTDTFKIGPACLNGSLEIENGVAQIAQTLKCFTQFKDEPERLLGRHESTALECSEQPSGLPPWPRVRELYFCRPRP